MTGVFRIVQIRPSWFQTMRAGTAGISQSESLGLLPDINQACPILSGFMDQLKEEDGFDSGKVFEL